MTVQSALKTVCAAVAGAGCIGGGTAIYYKQLPTTWRELFVKEGRFLLRDDNHWKAVYHDQKESSVWKKQGELNSIKSGDDAKTTLKNWCETKLDQKIEDWYSEDFGAKRDLYGNLCTADGIVTVKGKIVQSGKDNWIEGSNADEKYKEIFGVYRYNGEFLNWMKANGGDNDLSEESKIKDNYGKLKTLCESTLKKTHRSVEDARSKEIQYAHWWCTPLPYSTIRDKLKADREGWAEFEQSSGDWPKVLKKWKDQSEVKKWVKKIEDNKEDEDDDEEEEEEDTDTTITEVQLKKLCDNERLESKLSKENSYQKKYIVIMSVCDRNQQLPTTADTEEQV